MPLKDGALRVSFVLSHLCLLLLFQGVLGADAVPFPCPTVTGGC